jgi:hypothetical protein
MGNIFYREPILNDTNDKNKCIYFGENKEWRIRYEPDGVDGLGANSLRFESLDQNTNQYNTKFALRE